MSEPTKEPRHRVHDEKPLPLREVYYGLREAGCEDFREVDEVRAGTVRDTRAAYDGAFADLGLERPTDRTSRSYADPLWRAWAVGNALAHRESDHAFLYGLALGMHLQWCRSFDFSGADDDAASAPWESLGVHAMLRAWMDAVGVADEYRAALATVVNFSSSSEDGR